MTDLESIQHATRVFAEAKRITRCQKLERRSMLFAALAALAAVTAPPWFSSTKAGAIFLVAAFAVAFTAMIFSFCLAHCLRD